MNNSNIFEFPLSERIRVFMRLEQLFLQIDYFMEGNTIWDSRAVITTLLDILTIFSRNDLKSEILKELDRHSSILSRVAQNQGVDMTKVEQILTELETITRDLYATNGKIGLTLMESDLFKSISQRSSIPGGTFSFDLPAYHYWLQQNDGRRKQDLNQWIKPFESIRKAINMTLRFIRQSSMPHTEVAEAGFYQHSLDRSLSYQLLRVAIDRSLPYFAEISGGKHRFTIRFMAASTSERSVQTNENVPFELTRCLF
ncbi:MAG: cell division protein ZapD [Pseudomonadota bacterium]